MTATRPATSETVVVAARTSTTRTTLRRLRAGLLLGAALVMATSLPVFNGVQGAAEAAGHRTVPAIMAVASAQQALIEADAAAVGSFGAETVQITGPGDSYQTQMAVAGQNLERVAELNVAGDEGSRRLLLVDAQLATYRALVEQAHADYASGATTLGLVEIVYASQTMRREDVGVLADLDQLRKLQHDKLQAQRSSVWMHSSAVLIWALPTLALFALLGVTQISLSRRFSRTLNGWFVSATALLVVLTAIMTSTLVTTHRLAAASRGLDQVLADRDISVSEIRSLHTAPELLNNQCKLHHFACGGEVSSPVNSHTRANHAAQTARQAASAADHYPGVVIVGVGLAIALLAAFGLQRRIEEYRYPAR